MSRWMFYPSLVSLVMLGSLLGGNVPAVEAGLTTRVSVASSGDDQLEGGPGNDWLTGGNGDDRLDGARGGIAVRAMRT